MACRSVTKAEEKASELGFDKSSYTVMELELGDLASVRNFVKKFRSSKLAKNFQALICNAAIYYPNAVTPTFTKDGFEETVGVTHLGQGLHPRIWGLGLRV
jgi:protochlorophyllide reductase